jgi:hypothetical protein
MRLSNVLCHAAPAALFFVASLGHAQAAADKSKATAAKPATAAKAAAAPAKDDKAAAAVAPAAPAAPTAAAPAPAAPAATPPTSATPTASSSSSVAGSGATATGATGTPDGATYVVRLRDLEQHIDELKEQIRRSHTRLSLLSDTILSGGVGGARAEINFHNDLSSAFRLTGAVFVLDGAVQYNKLDESDDSPLASQKDIPIFSGSIPPGDHTVQVVIKLQGNGYGVFSYLRGYKFQVPNTHSFTITEGKTLKLDVIAWEKGDVTTDLTQRPAIRWTENVRAGIASDAPATAAPAAGISGGVSVGAGAK